MAESSQRVDEAASQLYAADTGDFVGRRKDLAAAARAAGDTAAAKQIAALRKPTTSAALVNAHVHRTPADIQRLLELGEELRRATRDLAADRLRALSAQRRALVGELAAAAIGAGDKPGGAVRDEVTHTFDAAVADPQIAHRLGRLTTAERWSGFGLADDGPELTLVRGGRTDTSKTDDPKTDTRKTDTRKTDDPKADTRKTDTRTTEGPSRSEQRRRQRELTQAQQRFDTAAEDLSGAEQAEQAARERLRELTAALTTLQQQLGEAKAERERSHREARAARARRREAQSALDRATRNSEH